MSNKTIKVIGKVKTNKNGTNYIDMEEGRVFLGKVSGFKAGDDINGKAICTPRTIEYPATAAVGTPNTPGYRAAQEARTEQGWQCENFISRAQVAADSAYDATEAKAQFEIARVTKATEALADVTVTSAADVFALVG